MPAAFRSIVAGAHIRAVPLLPEDQLVDLACALEREQHRSRCWTTPARLFVVEGVDVSEVAWRRIGEGNPYHLLETVCVDADALAVGLTTHGWAFPPDDPLSWYGRPSQHPGRLRVRTATVVGRDGAHCSAIRIQHRADVVVDRGNGEGPLIDALRRVWLPPRPIVRGPHPARCRRDG